MVNSIIPYTLEEATGKYAFVADRTTLIYNSCDELSMSHSFNCVDYGSRLFSNSNTAQCLDPDGNVHAGNITHLQLNVEENVSANTPFEEMAHDPMCYYRLPPQEFVIEEIEQADDHVIQHITETGTSREFLYYGKVMGNDLLLVTFENYNSDNTLTDTDIKDFVHYAEVLLGHLEPDDGSEPYLYDKLVNVPFIGGRYVTGFDHFISINGKTLGLETKKDTLIDYFTLVTDPEDSYLEKRDGMTDWEDENDIKMRESTVLCKPEDKENFVSLIFKYTTTIGIRETIMQRYTLDRQIYKVDSSFGPVRVKVSSGFGVTRKKFEYDDLARIAKENNLSIAEVEKKLSDELKD